MPLSLEASSIVGHADSHRSAISGHYLVNGLNAGLSALPKSEGTMPTSTVRLGSHTCARGSSRCA